MNNFYQSFVAIILLILLTSCGGDDSQQTQFQRSGGFRTQEAISVEVIPVQASNISEQVSAFGNIQAQETVEIMPQVSNRVTEIHADLGDDVRRGQLLAEIYAVPFREAVEQARAQVRQTRAAFERDSTQLGRQEQLLNNDLISQSEFDDARTTYLNSLSQYESAQSSLTQAQEDLDNTTVVSPVNGVVLSRSVSEGDLASTGQTLFEIANLTGFETRVFLPIHDWERIEIGQPVFMALSTDGENIAEGVVARKSPRLDPTTGLGEVVVALTNTSSSVYQGALVQTKINLQTKRDVVVIPRSALVEKVETYIAPETGTIELQRSYSAFVASSDTSAARRELELGIEQGDRIEIIDGLEPGDQLVVTGQESLEDGSPIRIANSTPTFTSGADTTGRIRSGAPNSRRPDSERDTSAQGESNETNTPQTEEN